MSIKSYKNALRLRAHHICCLPFLKPFGGRGSDFQRILDEIKSALVSKPDMLIAVHEGIDQLCQYCPFRSGQRCASPLGNEDAVRKWDAILLKELNLPFGTCLTAGEWQALIKQKTPFKLCQKCQWRQKCDVEASVL